MEENVAPAYEISAARACGNSVGWRAERSSFIYISIGTGGVDWSLEKRIHDRYESRGERGLVPIVESRGERQEICVVPGVSMGANRRHVVAECEASQ